MKRMLLPLALAFAGAAQADYKVDMKTIDAKGVGKSIGTVTISANPGGGVVFKPALNGLPVGDHGFHVHEKGDCGPKEKNGKPSAGEAAGPHWDPDKTAKHAGPDGKGHRGDLPTLVVPPVPPAGTPVGPARTPVVAKHLKLADLAGKSLMIHAGGDTYGEPPASGGGGDRIACGVIK
ncbi:MAG TPA: superoxide dismutase family protein [Usitatibacter sp.]|nr:superoxide dismutase family protein [Usitatibacter sp.]